MAKVAIIGTGYVGLATGACLSTLGHHVRCLDINSEKIELLQQGIMPIIEADLDSTVASGVAAGNLEFSIDVANGIVDCEVVFLCLPTPQGDDGAADLSYVMGILPTISTHAMSGAVIVNKSTVPVGTANSVTAALQRDDLAVVSNPEFLRQGTAVNDFLHPSRIVVGSDNERAIEKVAALYEKIDAPILKMNAASAEAMKYAANAFLATKLTFINAIADICEVTGADIFDVVSGLGLDPRIGSDFLRPGPGWGGSCFPKDTRALVRIAQDGGYDFALLRGVIETNDQQYERIAEKVIEECGGSVEGKTIAAWGLTFKAHTDDLRDSPAIAILRSLHARGASIRAFDPTAKGQYQDHPWISVVASALQACEGADALAVLTEWPEFATIPPEIVAKSLKSRAVVDGRNVLNRQAWRDAGFDYRGVGR